MFVAEKIPKHPGMTRLPGASGIALHIGRASN